MTYNAAGTHYFTIERPSQAEFRDRGSRFLAFAYPVQTADAFKKLLSGRKEEHPKAVHHCFAYRLGTDGNTYRANDDGEPSGTAGRPILGQIDSKSLTDTAVIVVRYFGGTLLGVPGLIHAYKTAASLALQLTPVVQKPVLVPYRIQFDYTMMNDVMLVIKRFGCTVGQKELQLFCRMEIGIPKGEEALCLDKLQSMHGLEIKRS